MSKELIERLMSYIPSGDGHNSQYANDLADAVAILEAKAAPVGDDRGHDTKGSRKALGAMNAKLKAKIGRLERELATYQRAQRAIAELREECERLRSKQGDPAGSFDKCMQAIAERDTLRQQLAERDAEIMEQCRLNGMGAERELKLLTQRDKLAGLMADVKADYAHAIHWEDLHATMKRIDATLAEVNK